MDVEECIANRRSTRKFLDDPLEWDKVGRILNAGRLAPSAGNLQSWKYILVREAGKKHAVAEACLQQYWIEKAPVIIIVCSQPAKLLKYYGIRGEKLYAVQDCAATSMSMLIMAHSLGVGACWVGAFDEDQLGRELAIPSDMRPQAVIPIGYADKTEVHPSLIHYTLENLTYFERWGNRVGDVDHVLWNYRVLEKGLNKANEAVAYIDKKTKDARHKLVDRLIEKTKSFGKKKESK